jgi:hypothetical protein
MKPSELPGARSLYRLTNRALAQIRELWQYAGEDELPPDSLLQAQVEALRILHIDVPLSAKRQFQLFCSEHFPGLAEILDCLAADQLWALLSTRVRLADSDQPQAQSAAVRFGGLGRRVGGEKYCLNFPVVPISVGDCLCEASFPKPWNLRSVVSGTILKP